MRTPVITEVYDIVSKMNGSFCSVDIFRELICPEWTYWEETRTKNMINKALKDFIVRSYAMRGYYTPYIPGWDRRQNPQRLREQLRHIQEMLRWWIISSTWSTRKGNMGS